MNSTQTASMSNDTSARYKHRRGEIETYFDRTAAEAWARLTSTAPVGRIRATVRAGRDRMRQTLLDWLPAPWVVDLCTRARAAKVKIALAGSLGIAEIRKLLPARPDWFAVRGAACEDSDRQAGVQLVKVRQLVRVLREN